MSPTGTHRMNCTTQDKSSGHGVSVDIGLNIDPKIGIPKGILKICINEMVIRVELPC